MKKIKIRADRDISLENLLIENNISRKLRSKAQGRIKKDSKVLYMSYMLKEGDIVTLYLEETKSDIEPIEMPLNIIYEDDELLVLDKPNNISCMSTLNMNEITLLNGLEYYFEKNNINDKVHMVNRLDRLTSGLMIVGKDRFSTSLLSLSLKKTLKRKYYAIVYGKFDKKEDEITLKIAKENEMSVRRVVRNDGKDAITRYKVIKEFSNYSLLEIELLTGRTHQIRVTFSFLGHPLVGDKSYSIYEDNEELMLHSYYLEFAHPKDNKIYNFDTGLPKRFKEFIERYE